MNITYCKKYSYIVFALAFCCTAGVADAGQIRAAKVAGRFYPESQLELHELVHELLERQPDPSVEGKPRILIVPHAGYQYSGLIAASGFRVLEGQIYDGVVVVGFTHRMQFDGVSVDTREAYDTPLGRVPIHQEAAAVLQAHPGIGHVEPAHEMDEHSMEVEIPFVQAALPHTRIVPMLIGNVRLEDARHLAEALYDLSRLGDYLFVFSTDLSHYHPYDDAVRIDEGTVHAILFETPQAVDRLFDRGTIEACGRGPIIASLLLAARLGYPQRALLGYANSGDTAGNPASVVGYAAIGMFEQPAKTHGRLSREAGHAMVQAARRVLDMRLNPSKYEHRLVPLGLDRWPELAKAQGIFVTLKRHGALRGCIGRIETDEPLAKTLPIVALESALNDSRFPPVQAQELDDIHIEVSVLTPPVRLKGVDQLVPGRDGVVLEYQGRHGVFLPQVWDETGWTRVEFLRELASQKAGLPPDAWQQATLRVFQDQIFEEPLLEARNPH